jgi:hypothetical protein
MGEELSFEFYDGKYDVMTAEERAAFDDAHNTGDAQDVLLQSGLWRVLEAKAPTTRLLSTPPKSSADWGVILTSTVRDYMVAQLRVALGREIADAALLDHAQKQARHYCGITDLAGTVVELRSSGSETVFPGCVRVVLRLCCR